MISVKKGVSTTDLVNFHKAMEELMKCPICLDQLQGPVYECGRGHPICLSCKSHLPRCAICQAEFNRDKTTILTQITEVIPQACEYAGCNNVSKPSQFHSRYCSYRPIKFHCCNETGNLRNLRVHYQNTHPLHPIFKHGSAPGSWPNILLFKSNESKNVISLFYFFGHFFWRKMAVDYENKQFTVTFGCVPTGEVKGTFWAHISFIRDHYQMIVATPIPVLDEDQSLDRAGQCLVMPLHQLTPFVTNNGILKFYKMDIKHIL